ncbi:MAG: hypothetical protein JSW25_06655 [Thermoplasmata archaeon]|nr:MAG: hypothetical protein JSW25_06655 [Thermoplasmata archaeon]
MIGRGQDLVEGTTAGIFDEEASEGRLLYREDDANFKRRLNTAIQMSWVFNTAITIIVCASIFYILDITLVMGVILGILLALMSNLHLTLSRVTKASRWEVYKNRVVMPLGMRGGHRTIPFDDIDTIDRQKGLTGETVVVTLKSGEAITLAVEEQRRPLEALDLAYRQYERSRREPTREIKIPISASE